MILETLTRYRGQGLKTANAIDPNEIIFNMTLKIKTNFLCNYLAMEGSIKERCD